MTDTADTRQDQMEAELRQFSRTQGKRLLILAWVYIAAVAAAVVYQFFASERGAYLPYVLAATAAGVVAMVVLDARYKSAKKDIASRHGAA